MMRRGSSRTAVSGSQDILPRLLRQPWLEPVLLIVGSLAVILAFTALGTFFAAVLILVEGLTGIIIVAVLAFAIMVTLLANRRTI